jgi:putative long chain acyl-CoA synthase
VSEARERKERDGAEAADRGAPRGGFARLAAALQNGVEIARFGGLGDPEPSPFEVVAEGAHHRLRRYFPDEGPTPAEHRERAPVLLIPPLMMTAEVWDVAPESSAVATLQAGGADPWVVDFGSPEDEAGGLERTLTDHVVAVSDAIETVRQTTGRDVHVMGYSQGGMFGYQAAAYRRTDGIASLVTFGSAVDIHGGLPSTIPTEVLIESIERFGKLQEALMPDGIPSWMTRLGFQLLDPIKTVQQRVDFVRRLSDREALKKREGMRRFMDGEGWTAFPGPALTDLLKQLVAQNRLLQGGLVINEQTVTLADISCPILAFVGATDAIAPPATVRAIYAAAPQADCYQIKVHTGHFGLVVGSRSNDETWPAVLEWLEWHAGRGPMPATASRLEDRPEHRGRRTLADDLRDATSLAWDLGLSVIGSAAQGLGDRIGLLGRFARNVAPQLSRLSRLAEIRQGTRVSPALSLRERAREAPDATFFLFEGRAHSFQAADVRIDNVVRGLLACGVRHGQHVGLLMEMRPSSVAAAVALSRLGAVTVMLRPDLPLADQLEVAPVEHLLCDPERGEAARAAFGRDVLVLGGGGEPRRLAPGLIDMEAIDPDEVELPAWYVSDPGLAGELALVLLTGDGDRLGTSRVSNRRWATSAYGTATACALTARDTVYCRSPMHHATGFLVCVGGALVSGARLAMASEFTSTIDPKRFWQDVRRYGANVVFYTGSVLDALVNAPASFQERHHSIRLFAGSGMPRGLWRRVVERFAPATVVEFFASTEGNAVLVNLTGEKIGSLGRPLPGAGEVRLAAWDLDEERLVSDASGFAVPCQPGEVGLLVERIDRERGDLSGRSMRGLFEAGDAWISTRDLARIDEDGDYWLVDHVDDVIHTRGGALASLQVENVLASEIDAIDAVAVYGVRLPETGIDVAVAAVTLRPGAKLDPTALRRGVEHRLPRHQRPGVVRVVQSLPLTAGNRTRKRALRAEGLGLESGAGETLWRAPDDDAYVPLSREDLPRLAEVG